MTLLPTLTVGPTPLRLPPVLTPLPRGRARRPSWDASDIQTLAPAHQWLQRGQGIVLDALDLPNRHLDPGSRLYACFKLYMPEGQEPTYGDAACLLAVNVGILALLIAPTLAGVLDFQHPVGPSVLNPHALHSGRTALAFAALLPAEGIVAAPMLGAWVYASLMAPVSVPAVRHGDKIVRSAAYSGALGAISATQAMLDVLGRRLTPKAGGPGGTEAAYNYYYLQAGALIGCLCLPLFVIGGWRMGRRLGAEVLRVVGQDEGYQPLSPSMDNAEGA